jgi:hypothetical protein
MWQKIARDELKKSSEMIPAHAAKTISDDERRGLKLH